MLHSFFSLLQKSIYCCSRAVDVLNTEKHLIHKYMNRMHSGCQSKLWDAISGGNSKIESTSLFVKCTNREGYQGAADGISVLTLLNHNPPWPWAGAAGLLLCWRRRDFEWQIWSCLNSMEVFQATGPNISSDHQGWTRSTVQTSLGEIAVVKC